MSVIIDKVNSLFKEKSLTEIEEYLQDKINDDLIILGNTLNEQLQNKGLVEDTVLGTCSKYIEIYEQDCEAIETSLMNLCFGKEGKTEEEEEEYVHKDLKLQFDILVCDDNASTVTTNDANNNSTIENGNNSLVHLFESIKQDRLYYDLELKLKKFINKNDKNSNGIEIFNEIYPSMLNFKKETSSSNNPHHSIIEKYYQQIVSKLEMLDIEQYVDENGLEGEEDKEKVVEPQIHRDILLNADQFLNKMVTLYNELDESEKKYQDLWVIVCKQLIKIYYFIETQNLKKQFSVGYYRIRKLILSVDTGKSSGNFLQDKYIEYIKSEIMVLVNRVDLEINNTKNEDEKNESITIYPSPTVGTNSNAHSSINDLYNNIENVYCNGWHTRQMVDAGHALEEIDHLFQQVSDIFESVDTSSLSLESHSKQKASLIIQDWETYKEKIYKDVLKIQHHQQSGETTDSIALEPKTMESGCIDTDDFINQIKLKTNDRLWNNYIKTLYK